MRRQRRADRGGLRAVGRTDGGALSAADSPRGPPPEGHWHLRRKEKGKRKRDHTENWLPRPNAQPQAFISFHPKAKLQTSSNAWLLRKLPEVPACAWVAHTAVLPQPMLGFLLPANALGFPANALGFLAKALGFLAKDPCMRPARRRRPRLRWPLFCRSRWATSPRRETIALFAHMHSYGIISI